MKKFTFKIEVIVYGDSEDEAKTTFCEDPNSWEFDESDLTLVSEETVLITVESPSDAS